MKVDSHVHFWPYQAQAYPWISDSMTVLRQDRLPQHFEALNGDALPDAVVAVQARHHSDETAWLLELATQTPMVQAVVGWVDFFSEDATHWMSHWQSHGAFKGLRHLLQDEPDVARWVHHPQVRSCMRWLQQNGLVFDLLVFEHQMPAVTSFCRRHDQHLIVLDHLGKPDGRTSDKNQVWRSPWRSWLQTLAALPHVVCKLSGLVTQTARSDASTFTERDRDWAMACMDVALEAFGANRLLYGSDWPVCELACSHAHMLEITQAWARSRLSQDEQHLFWGENASRCYGLLGQQLSVSEGHA